MKSRERSGSILANANETHFNHSMVCFAFYYVSLECKDQYLDMEVLTSLDLLYYSKPVQWKRSVNFEMSFWCHCLDQNSNENIVRIFALKFFVASWELLEAFLDFLRTQ